MHCQCLHFYQRSAGDLGYGNNDDKLLGSTFRTSFTLDKWTSCIVLVVILNTRRLEHMSSAELSNSSLLSKNRFIAWSS